MEISIESLKKVKLDKDDVLVVTFKGEHPSADEWEDTTDALKYCFPNNSVMCFNDDNIDLTIYTKKV